MSKFSTAVLTGALLFSLPAVAGHEGGSPNYTARQLVHCVMGRTKANPTEPYKIAFKACREQLESAADEDKTQTAWNSAEASPGQKR